MCVAVEERQVVDELLPARLSQDGRDRVRFSASAGKVFLDMGECSGNSAVLHLELRPARHTGMLRVPGGVLQDDTRLVQIEQGTVHTRVESGLVCHAVPDGLYKWHAVGEHEAGDAFVAVIPACAFEDFSTFGEKTSFMPTEETIGVLRSGHAVAAEEQLVRETYQMYE